MFIVEVKGVEFRDGRLSPFKYGYVLRIFFSEICHCNLQILVHFDSYQ